MGDSNELFEAGCYLGSARPGYFSTLVRDQEQRMHQESYELRYLADVIRALRPDLDSWVTQAEFCRPTRRAVHVGSIGVHFCDCDCYRVPELEGKAPEDLLAALLEHLQSVGLPVPSLVLFSGRGLQVKYLQRTRTEAKDIIGWDRTQAALVRALLPLGADPAARDVSRVLRVDRTVNSKSGELVRVLYVNGLPPIPYSGEDLAKALAPWSEQPLFRKRLVEDHFHQDQEAEQVEADATERDNVVAAAGRFAARRLCWRRVQDFKTLATLRGGFLEGQRELALFWSLCSLLTAEPGRAADLWREAEALAAWIAPGQDFYHRSDLSTLYRRAQAARQGVRVKHAGRAWSPIYSIRNVRLIETFAITPEEQRHMLTILGPEERRRRRQEGPWTGQGIARSTYYWRLKRGRQ